MKILSSLIKKLVVRAVTLARRRILKFWNLKDIRLKFSKNKMQIFKLIKGPWYVAFRLLRVQFHLALKKEFSNSASSKCVRQGKFFKFILTTIDDEICLKISARNMIF